MVCIKKVTFPDIYSVDPLWNCTLTAIKIGDLSLILFTPLRAMLKQHLAVSLTTSVPLLAEQGRPILFLVTAVRYLKTWC
jgi:hypothetical protein